MPVCHVPTLQSVQTDPRFSAPPVTLALGKSLSYIPLSSISWEQPRKGGPCSRSVKRKGAAALSRRSHWFISRLLRASEAGELLVIVSVHGPMFMHS